jgi:hypothetical protein
MAAGFAGVLAGTASGLITSDGRPRSVKKGVGTWQVDSAAAGLDLVRAKWYYDWQSTNLAEPAGSGVEFVPMIWGASSVTEAELTQAAGAGDTLLGFNEPDHADQANMTVAQALALWPQLMATGMRLGSPAPASDAATKGSWLDWFMSETRALGYRVDFIALHWYGSDFNDAAVEQLRKYLDAVHKRYGLPIWLTEYALARYDEQRLTPQTAEYPTMHRQVAFVDASTRMLESLPYVERYAWFALPTLGLGIGPGSGSGLCRPDATLTPVGEAYRNAG